MKEGRGLGGATEIRLHQHTFLMERELWWLKSREITDVLFWSQN